MNTSSVPFRIFWSIIARLLSFCIPVRKRHWVFGSDYGKNYREGSKYLMEYMLRNHKEYDCVYVAQDKSLCEELLEKGIPAVYNFSLKGIIAICKAQVCFTTQARSDIFFSYSKKGRHFYHLVHGQPYKVALKALSEKYYDNVFDRKHNVVIDTCHKIYDWLLFGGTIYDSDFVSACSEFLAELMNRDFGGETPVRILGMPRNDGLFDHERMKGERWVPGLEGKFVITYMPTHRAYGAGKLTPTPFADRPEIQEWMRRNNVVLLMKNHPNMIPLIKDTSDSDVIKDITKMRLDPQVCLYHSDALITDYSSVWMDYLLLERPVIFYVYDNWEQDDAGVYYDIREYMPENFCASEDELFSMMKRMVSERDYLKPSDDNISRFHKYVDGNSSQRYFEAIVKDIEA